MDLTPEKLRELLNYDPETGVLTWRKRAVRPGLARSDKGWNTRFVGKTAGRPGKHGHIYIGIAYRKLYETRNFAAHRLAWVHFYGEWPSTEIDHVNGVPSDNRISNLRLASRTQNMRNTRMRSDNTSGCKGVYWSKKSKKWCAFITINKKVTALGAFTDKQEAIKVRQDAARIYHGEFSSETVLEGPSKS